MAPRPEVPPSRGDRGVPLQRVDQRDDEVPPSWLAEAEHRAEAEAVDRLAEDYNLVSGLALNGFTGPKYEIFQTELARYGQAVIGGWMRRGLIFARCRERGYGGLPEAPTGALDDRDTVDELTGETVAKALVHFRTDVLLTGRWDYRKGASLRTFFIGQCLMRFPNIYRAWFNAEARRGDLVGDQATLDILERRTVPSVDTLVADHDVAVSALRGVRDPRVQRAMLLTAQDLPQSAIAEDLGVSEKTVERMIANERDRIRRRRGIA